MRGDPSQLQNAILNLGINARDAMPEGGELTFATRVIDLEPEFCRLHSQRVEAGTYVELSVSDTGQGMSPEVQDRIFEPFFTTKELGGGTGLGLAGVYGCVLSHNGLICVYSEPGRGSTFRVMLPLAMAPPSAYDTLTLMAPITGHGHVLVVDDERVVRDLAARALRRLGYTVTTCVDGIDGLEYFQAHHDKIDVVILDLNMPRLSGDDAFRRMRAINDKVPIIISSGFTHHQVTDQLISLGAFGFLHKPFRIDDLGRAVASCLAGDN